MDRMKAFTRENVLRWMQGHVREYATATELAEAAAEEFGEKEQPGPLDDEQHWIWEVALEAEEGDEPAGGLSRAFSRDPLGRLEGGA